MKFIAAVDENWGIGNKGKLLIRISEDQKFFRKTTMGHVVVLGRKTLEEFPGGKPLSGRKNIILSRNRDYKVEDAVVVNSVESLMAELKKYDTEDVYVIGGQSVYEKLIPYCDTAVITRIHRTFEADAFIPNLDQLDNWENTDILEEIDTDKGKISFLVYKNHKVQKL
jgi:dihydrofolate reductase